MIGLFKLKTKNCKEIFYKTNILQNTLLDLCLDDIRTSSCPDVQKRNKSSEKYCNHQLVEEVFVSPKKQVRNILSYFDNISLIFLFMSTDFLNSSWFYGLSDTLCQ